MKRLLIISVCFILALVILASCSAPEAAPTQDRSSSVAPAAPAPERAPSFDMAVEASPAEPSMMEEAEFAPPSVSNHAPAHDIAGPYFALPILTPGESGKMFEYTVTLNLQTTYFMSGMRKLLNTAGETGGYLLFANVQGHDLHHPYVERYGNFMLRIPSERLSEFIIVMENNFNVWHFTQSTEDSTARFDRTALQLDDLHEHERQLIEALAETDDSDERIHIQRWLSEVRDSIRSAEAAQALILDNVIYSTVHVQLFEVILTPDDYVPAPPPTFGDRLSGAVSRSADVFVAFGQGLLLIIIAIAPVLLILAVAGGVALLAIRIVKKRGKRTKVNRSFEIPDKKESNDIHDVHEE